MLIDGGCTTGGYRLYDRPMGAMNLAVSRRYDLPASQLWEVVSDLDGYASHADGLSVTEVIAGEAESAVRRCVNDKGQEWNEAVAEWQEGRRYVIEVDTDTYPPPLRQMFKSFVGTWSVEPHAEGCEVTMRFDAEVRGGKLGVALVNRMAAKAQHDLERTLDSYGRAASG